MRFDHKIILDIVEPNSHVLDLGCGDGSLLDLLKKTRSIKGYGIEIDEKAIYQCLEKGLSVSHSDIDSCLTDYSDKRFDYVILNESLQEVLQAKHVILESLRVGKKVIIGLPNFCHWKVRLQIFFKGMMPITRELPYEWYNTPNLRFLSIKDFRRFCRKNNITVLKEIGISRNRQVTWGINFNAMTGLYLLEKN